MTITYYQYHINDTTQNLFLDQGSFLSTWTPPTSLFHVIWEILSVCVEVRTVKKLLFIFLSPRFLWWYYCDSSDRSYPGIVMLSFSLFPEKLIPREWITSNPYLLFIRSFVRCVTTTTILFVRRCFAGAAELVEGSTSATQAGNYWDGRFLPQTPIEGSTEGF